MSGQEVNLAVPPSVVHRLCATRRHGCVLCVSQVNTGLIRTRAAQETPSKCSATSQQEGRRASTPIKNLRGYESKHQWLLHKRRRGAKIHKALNSLPFSFQVRISNWPKESPGSWFSEFKRGKIVSPLNFFIFFNSALSFSITTSQPTLLYFT